MTESSPEAVVTWTQGLIFHPRLNQGNIVELCCG